MDKSFRPWPWHRSRGDETLVEDRNGTEVAVIQGDYDNDYARMFDITNLIAAAPEMYEALKGIRGLVEAEIAGLCADIQQGNSCGMGDLKRLQAVLDALAKAEGK